MMEFLVCLCVIWFSCLFGVTYLTIEKLGWPKFLLMSLFIAVANLTNHMIMIEKSVGYETYKLIVKELKAQNDE